MNRTKATFGFMGLVLTFLVGAIHGSAFDAVMEQRRQRDLAQQSDKHLEPVQDLAGVINAGAPAIFYFDISDHDHLKTVYGWVSAAGLESGWIAHSRRCKCGWFKDANSK